MTQTVKQGDSLWIDYNLENWSAINATWGSAWEGIFEISVSESSTPLYTGTLTRSTTPGIMQLRLNTDSASTAPVLNWSAMSVGEYKLMVQFTNTTAKYREEYHEKLVVKAQGL